MAWVEMISVAVLLLGFVVGLGYLPRPTARRLIHISIRVRVARRGEANDAVERRPVDAVKDPVRRRKELGRVQRKPRATRQQLALVRAPSAVGLISGSRWG